MAENDIPRSDTAVIQENSSAFGDATSENTITNGNQHDYARKDGGQAVEESQASIHGVFEVDAQETDSDMEDSHHCGKCNIEFKSLEGYINHKLSADKCKVAYSRRKHKLIPKLVQQNNTSDKLPKKPKYTGKKKGPKQRHVASAHNQQDILSENEKSQYRCEICGRSFGRSAALRRHVDHEHKKKDSDDDLSSDEEEEEAGLEYTPTEDEPKFVMHQKADMVNSQITFVIGEITEQLPLVSEGKPVVCEICDRQVKDQHVLKAHLLTHTTLRAFRCSFHGCDYAFKTKGSLKRHMRRHTGERPYQCNVCARTFTESGALTRHLKARVSCAAKSNDDFPRYGKRKPLKAVSSTRHDGVIHADNSQDEIHSKHGFPEQSETSQNSSTTQASSVDTTVNMLLEGQESDQVATYCCQVCMENFLTMNLLQDHLKTHIGNCPLKCGLCNYASVDVDDFLFHLTLPEHLAAAAAGSDACGVLEGDQEAEDGKITSSFGDETLPDDENRETAMEVSISNNDNYLGEEEEPDKTMEKSVNGEESLVVYEEVIQHQLIRVQQVVTHGESVGVKLEEGSVGISQDVTLDQEEDVVTEEVCHPSTDNVEDGQDPEVEDVGLQKDIELVKVEGDHMNGGYLRVTQMHSGTDGVQVLLGEHVEPSVDSNEGVSHSMIIQGEEFCEEENSDDKHGDDNQFMDVTMAAGAMDEARQATEDGVGVALQQLLSLQKTTQMSTEQRQGSKSMLYTCPICFRNMKAAAYLKLHMKTHLVKKQHTCRICQRFFNSKDALNKHVVTHSNARNYKCGECGKFFKRISHVREHLRVHSENRPYLCTVCLKSFKSANACRVHMRTHTQVMPFTCDCCGKQFREKASLQRHVRSHTGERPYTCKYCSRGFAEHGTLNRHLRAKVPCYLLPKDESRALRQADQVSSSVMKGKLIMSSLDGEQAVTIEDGSLVEEHSTIQAEVADKSVSVDPDLQPPNLLTEFSTMVADTQHYIMQEAQEVVTEQGKLEYVMVSNDGISDDAGLGNSVEIVYDDCSVQMSQDVIDADKDAQFVVVGEVESGDLLLLNTQTGQTFQAPAHSIQVEESTVVEEDGAVGVKAEGE